MNYLVKMTPCEPYTFGTEQSFAYAGIKRTGKETYFVRSKDMPEQTTILGMLRCMILESEGLLRSDFQYSPEAKKRMDRCIGPESFCFGAEKKQDFGYLHNVSPVFLIDNEGDYYIKNPFHNKSEKGYLPMKLTDNMIETSSGRIYLPKEKEYDVKKGYGAGYYNLTDGVVRKELFRSVFITGNRKSETEETVKDGLFKREVKWLKRGFSMAVFIEAETFPESGFAYMGMKKSLFQITARKVSGNDLIEKVKKAFDVQEEAWQYALSDLVVYNEISHQAFCIVEEKQVRNLETNYQSSNYVNRFRKSEVQYNLIQSGSVFYKNSGLQLENENCRQIGYNHLVQLGGK